MSVTLTRAGKTSASWARIPTRSVQLEQVLGADADWDEIIQDLTLFCRGLGPDSMGDELTLKYGARHSKLPALFKEVSQQ